MNTLNAISKWYIEMLFALIVKVFCDLEFVLGKSALLGSPWSPT